MNLFNICCFMDGHGYTDAHGDYDCLAAAGCKEERGPADLDARGSWVFGHFSYEAGYEMLGVGRQPKPTIDPFPVHFFFVPQQVIIVSGLQVTIESESVSPDAIYHAIRQVESNRSVPARLSLRSRVSRQQYVEAVNRVLDHIQRGDCYELNYCQEFFSDNAAISPVDVYLDLCQLSPAPFSVFYKVKHAYVLSASPERFLCRRGEEICSQPIKGTIHRDPDDPAHDQALKDQLYTSDKERSENVMVVDMVRNDLSKICQQGTVRVEELYGIYSFPQVHQMISTITGKLKEGIDFKTIVEATFPMGSMTGAPKKRVVELIQQYEPTERGIYSGTVGYISPQGDFDFNVIIRSIVYDALDKTVRYATGGGITANSSPDKEYEESLLKASAIKKVLERSST